MVKTCQNPPKGKRRIPLLGTSNLYVFYVRLCVYTVLYTWEPIRTCRVINSDCDSVFCIERKVTNKCITISNKGIATRNKNGSNFAFHPSGAARRTARALRPFAWGLLPLGDLGHSENNRLKWLEIGVLCGNKCHASSNKCLTTSNKKLLVTSARIFVHPMSVRTVWNEIASKHKGIKSTTDHGFTSFCPSNHRSLSH